jgi:hypothetical protein
MAWSLIADVDAGSSGGGTFTSGAINTTGATLLIAVVTSFASATAPTLTDSAGNTWVSQTAQSSGGLTPGRLQIFWVDNNTPNTSASHTVTLTGAGAFSAVEFAAFSGSGSNPDDQFSTVSTGIATASPSANPITPTLNDSLIIAAFTHSSATTPSVSIDSGMTIVASRAFSSGNHFACYVAWLEQITAASIDPTWTLGTAQTCAVQVMSFKPPTSSVAQPFSALLVSP